MRDFTGASVAAHKRIVLTDSFAYEMGNVVPATRYGLSPAGRWRR